MLFLGLVLPATTFLWSQKLEYFINRPEVERIGKVLAADSMQGRRTFSPGIEKAAEFIEAEFKAIGLRKFDASDKYRQTFSMVRPRLLSLSARMDGMEVDSQKALVITCQPSLSLDQTSGYEIIRVAAGRNLFREVSALMPAKKNILVLVDESYAADFSRLVSFKRSIPRTDKSLVLILTNSVPSSFAITSRHEISEQKLSNLVGVIPGRSKKNEIVIFSAHYDHLGIGKPVNGDSIFNGANDNASGVTAVIMLAKYFREMKYNERTLVFVAFTGEEVGGFGSQYFSRQLDPDRVVAMFNIEMIGTESKWGKNSAFVTGYEKTNMGSLLQRNLENTAFQFYPDPYPDMQLFYRSDNATLARLGVPAHTISTSKMDIEPDYHQVTDETGKMDFENMTMIIRSIALSAMGFVVGKDTPTRVKAADLR